MFADCAKILNEFKNTTLEDACEKLLQFDLYHLLFKQPMSASLKVSDKFSFAPDEYLKWCRLCAGGDLQVCELLGEKGIDRETGIRYSTYDEYEKESRENGLPDEYYVFAVANFGDYYCFRKPTDGTKDASIYQWGVHEREIVLIWDSYSDWFSEQIDTWVEMIADDELDPITVKMEDGNES